MNYRCDKCRKGKRCQSCQRKQWNRYNELRRKALPSQMDEPEMKIWRETKELVYKPLAAYLGAL